MNICLSIYVTREIREPGRFCSQFKGKVSKIEISIAQRNVEMNCKWR